MPFFPLQAEHAQTQTRGINPTQVLRMVKLIGGKPRRVLIVGCEPATLDNAHPIGLSPAVENSLDEAVNMVEALVQKISSAVPALM